MLTGYRVVEWNKFYSMTTKSRVNRIIDKILSLMIKQTTMISEKEKWLKMDNIQV